MHRVCQACDQPTAPKWVAVSLDKNTFQCEESSNNFLLKHETLVGKVIKLSYRASPAVSFVRIAALTDLAPLRKRSRTLHSLAFQK